MDARSGVGASGLMQVMPATARWTAHKIGMTGFTPDQLNDRDTNIAIGTGYLKLVLDDFDGSMPLAAAAYNAGPGRPRAWRNGPVMEAAIWAENVPFSETRDYVKKVLANTTNYAAILTGQPQSLKARLGPSARATSGRARTRTATCPEHGWDTDRPAPSPPSSPTWPTWRTLTRIVVRLLLAALLGVAAGLRARAHGQGGRACAPTCWWRSARRCSC